MTRQKPTLTACAGHRLATRSHRQPWSKRSLPASPRNCAPRVRQEPPEATRVTEVLQVMLLNNIKAKDPAS